MHGTVTPTTHGTVQGTFKPTAVTPVATTASCVLCSAVERAAEARVWKYGPDQARRREPGQGGSVARRRSGRPRHRGRPGLNHWFEGLQMPCSTTHHHAQRLFEQLDSLPEDMHGNRLTVAGLQMMEAEPLELAPAGPAAARARTEEI